MFDKIWKFNRWYDDLDKTNPAGRFIYFMLAFMFIVGIPLWIILLFGYNNPIIDIVPYIILTPVAIIRIVWLRKNGVL